MAWVWPELHRWAWEYRKLVWGHCKQAEKQVRAGGKQDKLAEPIEPARIDRLAGLERIGK